MNFGIEIEVGKAYPSLLNKLRNATGLRLSCHDDGSIRENSYAWDGVPLFVSGKTRPPIEAEHTFFGLEIITPILDEANALDFCRTAARIMEKIPTSRQASIHIHVDVRGRPWIDVKNIILAFAHFENYWYQLGGLGQDHRGIYNNFMYCRPLRSPIAYPIDQNGQTQLVPLFRLSDLREADTASQFAAAWGRLDLLWGEPVHYIPHRLHGINFASVMRQGSLEFRVFNAVYGQLERALTCVMTFVDAVLDGLIDLERPAYTQLKRAFGSVYWDQYKPVTLPDQDDLVMHHYRRRNLNFSARKRRISNGFSIDDGSKDFSFYV